MILNSLLRLAITERKNTFHFLQELFYTNDYQLTQDEKAFIYNALIEYSKDDTKNIEHFLQHFNEKKEMYNILILLSPDNKFGFFTNNKRVYLAGLDEKSLTLTLAYLNIFGFQNVQN